MARTYHEIAIETAKMLSQRWGLEEADGIHEWLERVLRETVREQAKSVVPDGEDEVELLAGFIADRHGIDRTSLDQLDFRQKAVTVLNAIEGAGLRLADLALFFIPERP